MVVFFNGLAGMPVLVKGNIPDSSGILSSKWFDPTADWQMEVICEKSSRSSSDPLFIHQLLIKEDSTY